MLFTFHERVPQKGKYNLYYSFGKGYINQIRELREHYGAQSSFSKERSKIYKPNYENNEEGYNQPQSRNTFSSDTQRGFSMDHSAYSLKNPEESSNKLNISHGFDKFLQKPNEKSFNESFKKQHFSEEEKNPSLKGEVTLSSSLKQSYSQNKIRFGSSTRKERFENLSFNKTSDFPAMYSDFNSLVTGNNPKNMKAIEFYKQNFGIKPKDFDEKKLDLVQNQERLTTPLEKRLEIQEVKKNNEKYFKWKREFMNSQKKYRVTKSSFRSGILNIDNPHNELTQVYEKEYEVFKKKEIAKEIIQARHKQQLENLTKTHQDIAFFNKNARKNDHLQSNNTKNNEIKIVNDWTRKARIKENFYQNYLGTQDRLFGSAPNKYSLNRAEHIMNCENKGKKWDIISFKTNDIQLKVDQGVAPIV